MSRASHWIGSLLAAIGIVFVTFRAIEYSAEIDLSRFTGWEWSMLSVLTLIYGLANLLLVSAWWNLLNQFDARISGMQAVKICGATQIAKYVPGNIFHLVGRQALGMAEGMPGVPLAKSALWEIGLIVASASLLGLFTLNLVLPDLTLFTSAGAYMVSTVLVIVILRRVRGPSTVFAFMWYTVFLAATGLLFIAVMELVVTKDLPIKELWLPLGAAYVLAWLIGLVTPGAPAGVGVREMVLMYLLEDTVDGADLMLGVLLGRLVTVGGDVAFFLFAKLLPNATRQSES